MRAGKLGTHPKSDRFLTKNIAFKKMPFLLDSFVANSCVLSQDSNRQFAINLRGDIFPLLFTNCPTVESRPKEGSLTAISAAAGTFLLRSANRARNVGNLRPFINHENSFCQKYAVFESNCWTLERLWNVKSLVS